MNQYQRARERSGFTQKEFGKLVGVESSVISRYETDIASNFIIPSKERREKMAEACGITLSFLENDDVELKKPLTFLQSSLFRERIKDINFALNDIPDDVLINRYGNSHPFRYMLKDRWQPIVEDVEYLCLRFGIDKESILNPDISKEYDDELKDLFPELPHISRDDEEFSLNCEIDRLLIKYYSAFTDETITKRIADFSRQLSLRGKIDLLRIAQKMVYSGIYKEKTPQTGRGSV